MLRYAALMLGGALVGWSLASLPVQVARNEAAGRSLPGSSYWLVRQALDEQSELDFGPQPFRDVVEYLSHKHHIPIEFDEPALEQAGVGGDTTIDCSLDDLPLRSLLELVLGKLGLAYVVDDGFLLITTVEAAEESLHVQVYPVGDLVTPDSEFRSPFDPAARKGADFRELTEVITNVVAPVTWDELGGPGSITANNYARAIAISQTDEVHEQVAALLTNLRRVRDKQIAAARSCSRGGSSDPHAAAEQGELEVRVYRFFQAPPPLPGVDAPQPPAATGNDQNIDAESAKAKLFAAEALATAKLDAWTKVVAKLVPESIAPETWEPIGPGQIRAESGMVVVRHTAEMHFRVAKLIYGMLLPGIDSAWYPLAAIYNCVPPVRLPPPPVTARWPQAAEPAPGAGEARIRAALEQPCRIQFAKQPLTAVISELAQRHGLHIDLDRDALQRAAAADAARITRSFNGIKLKNALRLLLDSFELAQVVRGEMLVITSKEKAEARLLTKVYPVFDLVVRRAGAPPQAPAMDFQSLIQSITASLAPTTWDEVGGPGEIRPFTNAGAIVISQTAAVHEQVAAFLQAMREAAAQAN